jgi:hypothetical protein
MIISGYKKLTVSSYRQSIIYDKAPSFLKELYHSITFQKKLWM